MDFLSTFQLFGELFLLVAVSCLVLFFSMYISSKNSRSGFKILFLYSVIMSYFLYCEKLDDIFLVPLYVSTFSELNEETKWPLRMSLLETDLGGNYVEVTISPGKIPALIRLSSFRSGMPAYIFNENGVLIDRTVDQHDDARYQEKWEKHKRRKLITKSNFLEIIRKGGSKPNLTNDHSIYQ